MKGINLDTFEELSAIPQCNCLKIGVRIQQPEHQECAQILNLEKSSRYLKPQNGNASLSRNAEFQSQTVNGWTSSPNSFIWFCICIS